jgi:probable phosphoglycerate mutase
VRTFLRPLRTGAHEARIVDATEDVLRPLLARALGLSARETARIAIDPGAVTILSRSGDGVAAAMVNVHPGDPLRRRQDRAQRRLYLVRHGEADTPTADGHLLSHVPIPLTERGRWQAERLREAFAGVPAPVVHASDIARTTETAQGLAGPERPVRPNAGLRELSLGDFDGAHADEILAAAPGFLIDPDAALPGGESIRDVAERAGPALDAILAGEADELIVVAHGGVNRALLGRLLRLPMDRAMAIRQDWACVNVLEEIDGRWTVGMLNWTPAGLDELDHAHRTAHLHERQPPREESPHVR